MMYEKRFSSIVLVKMERKLFLSSVIILIVSFKFGETLTLSSAKKNETDQLVANLSKVVEGTAGNVKSALNDAEVSTHPLLDQVANFNRKMEMENRTWFLLLDDYKKNASDKHINISSCLGKKERKLEQQYTIYSNRLFNCAYELINITGKYIQHTLETVNSTISEVEKAKKEVEACGGNTDCLEKMNTEIRKDLKIFPAHMIDMSDESIRVINKMMKKEQSCAHNSYIGFFEYGDIIYKDIITCIESKKLSIGETLAVSSAKNNESDQLIANLSKVVEGTASNVKSALNDAEVSTHPFLDEVASFNRDMERQNMTWILNLANYKKEASDKHINISSCLGENERKLEQEYLIYSGRMFDCAYELINITGKYIQHTLETINSTISEVEKVKREVKACEENTDCLEKVNTEIRKDLRTFPAHMIHMSDETIRVINKMVKKGQTCATNSFNGYFEDGDIIYKDIITCIESKKLNIGQTLTLSIFKNNETDQLVGNLSKVVENTASNVKSALYYAEYSKNPALDKVASWNREMEIQERTWSTILADYKDNASKKHINISSCLGESERELELQYTINSKRMFNCADELINITLKYAQQTLETVNSTISEVEKVKQEVEACGENTDCLKKMDTEIKKDLKIFPARMIDISDKTIRVINKMVEKVDICVEDSYYKFINDGEIIYKDIVKCIVSK